MSLNSPDSYLDIHDANLRIGGDVEAQAIKLAQIEIISNATTTSTVQFNNATKSFDAASNIEVGTANLFVDTTTSMVGIGTNAPAYTLDVDGDINFTGSFNQNGSAFVSTPWTIETGPSALSYTAGNVGIGAASPDATLHVTGNAYISSELTTNSNISAGYNQTTTSYFGKAAIGNDGYHTANAAFAHITKMGQNDYALKQNGSGRTDINSASGQDILFKNMDTEKAKITSTGNFVVNTDTLVVNATNSRVGIGTSTDPLSKLQIHEGDGEGTHRTLTWSSTRSDATKPLLGYLGTTASGAYASGGLGLFKNTLVGGTEDETVRIQANGDTWFNGGDVGIGTNNPGVKLHVNGSMTVVNLPRWRANFAGTAGDILSLGTVIWPNVDDDNRSGYDTTTGLYTVQEAGHYFVYCHMFTDAGDSDVEIAFRINGSDAINDVGAAFSRAGESEGYTNLVLMSNLDLNVNDTIGVTIRMTGVHYNSRGVSYFGGYKIC